MNFRIPQHITASRYYVGTQVSVVRNDYLQGHSSRAIYIYTCKGGREKSEAGGWQCIPSRRQLSLGTDGSPPGRAASCRH
ncbi:hypothetical protein E2C01_090348 [Portunus trituberculatus]|uniref:Uncharacterized protein n=1 Tax=Portunus trituberculatus TaxID=210409 RepID=A0A5B7JB71_PORTR|nr:hypothetical protein [Portunus trituberculatus]